MSLADISGRFVIIIAIFISALRVVWDTIHISSIEIISYRLSFFKTVRGVSVCFADIQCSCEVSDSAVQGSTGCLK